ncbi:MAG: peptidoglycan DD-metalloendopeptidase family protein [Actinophytocola sp.]|uniref:M23 family metallopeptidase n=1 Tax=Actinophytocola sp. TaxID=1872138 RepID=UPI001327CE4E|nr:M23 family metallopeptidase [Actinophytocola sp.]MPZ82826.1 peptidoglycan DD-metalloendopeptidase family protein [Actinophytocola sp.]
MRRFRVAVALAGAVLASSAVVVFGAPPEASAAPAYQMPFPCGQVWSGQTRSDHSPANAVDLNRANDDGDPVGAAAAGRVSRVANEGSTSYGRWIEIDHGGGLTTRYAHLSVQRVAVGDQVSPGQLIGNVGTTGGSTGPHLHFEERSGTSAVRISFNGSQILYWGTRSYTSHNTCAANNPYTPQAACGSGFQVIDWAALGSAGTTYLLYNGSTNCVATIKSTSIGTASATSAFLEVQGGTRTTDSGSFAYYAGPVKKSAAGKCVRWGGSVGSSSYTSPFEHCG